MRAAVLLLIMPLSSPAGIITLLDLTDTITMMDDTGRAALACSSSETCTVTLRPSAGTADFAQNFIALDWVEPGTTMISDSFCTLTSPCSITAQGASIGFVSDAEGASPGSCAACRAEDGTPQTAVTITWLTATGAPIVTDSIKFQSDIETPEPLSALLVLAGCAALCPLLAGQKR